jgi:6-phosphogluconolactonase (cycloisomerase 2 family)
MFAFIGCFTTAHRKARGKGISVYRIDASSGPSNNWSLIEVYETIANPGYVALDSQQRFLYASHGDGDTVSAYAVDPQTRKLTFLNQQQSCGDNGPHLIVDPSDHFVVVANGPGIAVLPINADGSLAPATDAVVPPGKEGPYKREQGLGAHPHQVVFDPAGRFLVAPDKGVDATHIYRLDAAGGKLVPNDPPFVKSRYGAGPRHLSFHPSRPFAYLINELDSSVTTCQWDGVRGVLTPVHIIPTTPPMFVGDNTGAEIAVAPSGKFVYVSNRGHNSIATFAVDARDATLARAAWEPTQGRKPRFFTLDPAGEKLYVANEDSDTIVAFGLDAASGKPVPTGLIIHTGSPSCIAFAA